MAAPDRAFARRLYARLDRRELEVLAFVFLIALTLLGFEYIAAAVLDGSIEGLDRRLLLALRNPADPAEALGPRWLLFAARDITSLGGFTVLTLVTFAVAGLLVMIRKWGAAVLVGVTVGGGSLLSTWLKQAFERPRPDLVPHGVEVMTTSFPSGHAMLSAVTYLTLGALLARVQPRRRVKAYLLGLAILVTLLVGLSRIYLGVHWPSDVLAGWCVGAGWAALCWLVALWLQRRGQVESDGEPGAGQ